MKSVFSTCSYCGVGCGVRLSLDEATGCIDLAGDADYPVNKGMLCAKGMNLHHTVMDTSDRLTVPQMRGNRGLPLADTTWEAALNRTAKTFQALIKRYGPDSVGFYVSGQLLTEEYYLANKIIKGMIGSNNIDTNSRLCMSSAVTAYKKSLGEDCVPVCYDDIEAADCLLIAGANPAWCHPILFRRMEAAKAANPSCKWIVVDPRRTQSTQQADLHLQLKPGSDVALFHAIARCLIENGQTDAEFIRRHVNGFDELVQQVMSKSLSEYAALTDVPEADIRTAADWIGQADGFLSLWTMGLNQSAAGTDKSLALINLSLITGKIGRAGNGPFSLTGQPNAMGGREVGGLATMLAVHKDFHNPQHRREVAEFWQIPPERLSDRPGLTATEMVTALEEGRLKAVWIICTNPAVSMPDARRFEAALRQARFVVVQDISRLSSTLPFADVVLPAAGYMEKSGVMTNAERRMSLVSQLVPPPGQALSDVEILCRFARKMGWGKHFAFKNSAEVFAEYARMTQGTNLDISGLTHEKLQAERSLQWPLQTAGGTQRLFTDARFYTPDGKANVYAPAPDTSAFEPLDAQFPLILTSGRIRDQWHTMTRTGKVSSLRQHLNEPYLEIHPTDAAARQIADGDMVRISGRRGEVRVRAMVSDSIKAGVVFLPMHWGRKLSTLSDQTFQTASAHDWARANNLTDCRICPQSKQPDFKYSAVEVAKCPTEHQRIIVIGAGTGAAAFLEDYRRLGGTARIDVFSQEAHPFYNRILLPDYLSGEKEWAQLPFQTAFTDHPSTHIHAANPITAIHPADKTVTDSRGVVHAYDKLLLATGSRAFIPPHYPSHADNFFTVRTREDIDRLHLHDTPERVAVIGGGLLGLEMAEACRLVGHTVSLIQVSGKLMSRQLDDAAARLLYQRVSARGLDVRLNEEVAEFEMADGRVCALRLKSGQRLPVDILIAAIGTRPNLNLLRDAGIRCERGAVVDDQLQTSDPHIYAIGEIAEWQRQMWGIASAAQEQAAVVAHVLTGNPNRYYSGSLSVNILKLNGIELASMGLTDIPPGQEGYQTVKLEDFSRHYYKKCIIRKNKLVGAILMGNKDEMSDFKQWIAGGIELEALRDKLLRGGMPARPPMSGKPVCACSRVGEGNILDCLKQGAADLSAVMQATGAGTGCGSCKPELAAIISRYTQEAHA